MRVVLVDYIAEAVAALQHTPVYVAPGTEGTDRDTTAKLQSRLTKDDNIVLVMLPASAEAELGTISTIVGRLSEALGDHRIIGLSVGKKVVGFAPSLPAGTASDLMRRAESVSQDPLTALGTFVQNVHLWQVEHPPPKPPVPFVPPKDTEIPWFPTVLTVPALAGYGIYWIIKRRMENEEKKGKTRFNAPDKVGELLAQIARERWKLNDPELIQVTYQMCLDMEKYFSSFSKDKSRDARAFQDRLKEVSLVLEKYIEIQNNPRYYKEPGEELNRGKESITGFSEYLLDSIQSGRQADLIDYTVNTNILEAQKYRR